MREKHFPSIFGLILLLVILFFGIKLSLQKTSLFSKASGNCLPEGVQVTNLTHHSLDLSFITSSPCLSILQIDNRYFENFQGSSLTHYFRVDNLQPKSDYQYSISSGGQNYQLSEYKVKTASKPALEASTSNLAWGKIIKADSSPSPNTILYLTISGALPLSAITDQNGQWHISLANSFTDSKDSWFSPPDSAPEDLIVYPPEGTLTQISHTTSQNDPVPDIIIGQNYLSNPSPSGLGSLKSDSLSPSSNIKLEINNPTESENIHTLRPDIFGVGPANSQLVIKLESSPVFEDSVITSTDGSWNWSPPQNLTPGPHTLSVSYQDAAGLIKTIQRSFIVEAASGDEILSFSATPSATIRITPTSVPTPVPTIIPTTIPTIRTSKPSTKSGVPVTGSSLPGLILVLSSIFALGISLYFYRRDEK
jgi:hypothetical protein